MEANRVMNEKFSYLIKIQIGPHSQSILVVNEREVPVILLETMAKEKISSKINELYAKNKDYRVQTTQQYFSRMIKQSDFQIEDLNDIEIYTLDLKFDNSSIKNEINKNDKTKIIEAKFDTPNLQFDNGVSDY